jgi:hypothetical protein
MTEREKAKPEHAGGTLTTDGKTKAIPVKVRAPLEKKGRETTEVRTMVAAFDEDDTPLGYAPVEGGVAQLALPAAFAGRAVRVFHAPIEEGVPQPSVGRLRRRLAVEQRLLIGRGLELELPASLLKFWKLSCCRIRGRVVMRVTLPNGTVQERPLCNARVVICEVDRSMRWLIRELPNDLIFRIRDEFLTAVPEAIPPVPPVMRTLEIRGAPVTAAITTAGDAPPGMEHAGPHGPAEKQPAKPVARERLPAVAGAMSVHLVRDSLIDRLELLKPQWCLFDWMRPFYRVDCLKTVAVDENGNFDTDIQYPCYGDRPDLYFKVEQDCHPGGWLLVHAPAVQCNTYWDYCCGTEIKIVVTHPTAAPGRAPTPCPWPYIAGDPMSVGSWELLSHDSGVFAVHAALLPTGKVLLFSGTAEANLPRESRVWDPVTDTLTSQSFGDDLFCAGHAMLADGRVLVNGGAIPGQGRGIKATHIFDPVSESWTKVKDMNHARWYPTTLTLPDGRVITFSGRDENAGVVSQVEVYDPAADTWTDLPVTANKALDIYPSLHLMPDGSIFYTGTRWAGSTAGWMSPPATARLDLATNTWTNVDDHEIPDRTEGFSVLLPPFEPGPFIHEHDDIPKPAKEAPSLTRVLVVGGPGATAAAEIIDLADGAPLWRRTADMNFPRRNVNGVLLPDGSVLVCSGIRGYKWDSDPGYVYEAELFDPQTETWTIAAPMTVGRQYHSASLLLADGRVLNIGSQGASIREMRMEVYSPPYLFHGPRPKITSAPAATAYGAEFVIESPDSCRIDRVVLVRPSAVTHQTNTDQRCLPLKWHRDGHCGLRITAPATAQLAPPSYYLLFILDDCGVPSIGRFIQLQ